MRRVLTGAALIGSALIGVAAAPSSSPVSHVQTIYIQNHSSFVSDAEVRNDIPAFQTALTEDFAPLWHIDSRLEYLPRTAKIPKGAASITLVDKGPVKGALAYHEMRDGVADAVVYAGVSKFYGYAWSVGLTHELWEMLVDGPAGNGSVDAVQAIDGRVWAQEIADPCEADSQGYDRAGADGKPVRISDFITPRWYGTSINGPYDFMQHIQQPLEILKGGYAQYLDPFAGWTVVSNFIHGGMGANGAFYD